MGSNVSCLNNSTQMSDQLLEPIITRKTLNPKNALRCVVKIQTA